MLEIMDQIWQQGNYICFIDSDDKIENNYVEKLLGAIKENKAEVVVCSFKQWYKDKTSRQTKILKIKNTVAKIISENFYLIGHVD